MAVLPAEQALGLGLVLAVSIIWVLASFLVQDLEQLGVHPVVVTCVSNSLFAIYLPVYLTSRFLGIRSAPIGGPESSELDQCPGNEDLPSISEWKADWRGALQFLWGNQLFKAAVHVAPLWFFAQLTFNASLSMTSVTSNTILSSTSALFTFLFSVLLLSERFTYFKLGCILALMMGTGMVTFSDGISGAQGDESSKHSIWGDFLCLISAALYGMYTVSIRSRIQGDDRSVPMTLFFAFMGVLIALTTGPVLLFLVIVGVPLGSMSLSIFGMLILKGCLDNVLSDWMWARAILLIGPTLATSGLALQVPIAVVSDVLISHPAWLGSLLTILLTTGGGSLILAAFFGLVMGDVVESKSGGALDI
jgi:solute carrier family 35, member F5